MKQNQPDSQSTYQTGSTTPKKSHYGIIAILLMLITVLCSVVTILSMMNIRLSKLLELQTLEKTAYEPQEQIAQVDTQPRVASIESNIPVLGLTCEEIDNLYRVYHQLPQGLYISHIEPNSYAHQAGLLPGDVLISCDDQHITKTERFFSYVDEQPVGTVIYLTVFRNDQQLTIPLTI